MESWPPSHLLLQDRERKKMARFGSTRQPAKERGVDRCNVCSHSVCWTACHLRELRSEHEWGARTRGRRVSFCVSSFALMWLFHVLACDYKLVYLCARTCEQASIEHSVVCNDCKMSHPSKTTPTNHPSLSLCLRLLHTHTHLKMMRDMGSRVSGLLIHSHSERERDRERKQSRCSLFAPHFKAIPLRFIFIDYGSQKEQILSRLFQEQGLWLESNS